MLVLENNNVTSIYLAAKALVGIGRKATPFLVEMLKRADEPYSVRRNVGPLFALPAPQGRFEHELTQAIWISLR